MRTSIDCFPCMMRQASTAARLAQPHNLAAQELVMRRFAEKLATQDLSVPPPGVLRHLYAIAREACPNGDPYAAEKAEANNRALALLPALRDTIRTSADPLLTALHLSVIGNYLDPGAGLDVDVEDALRKECSSVLGATPAYATFRERARDGASVLVIGDNCGEVALDTLLVGELLRAGCRVTYATRDVPVLNDATLEDAATVGMNDLCTVISSGCDAPGCELDRCSPTFLHLLDRTDVVVAKGQGNYESMESRRTDTFYAFKAKCAVVVSALGVPPGTTMFLHL